MARPQGEELQALHAAAATLHVQRGTGATWRELAEAACVGYTVARTTVHSMAKRNVLRVCGTQRVPGSRRPMALYAPPVPVQSCDASIADVMHGWARG